MSVHELIKTIQNNRDLHKQVSTIMEKKDAPPQYAHLEQPLPAPIQCYLEDQGIQLYIHQAEVLEKARAGSDVALVTSTASGKTLAFLLPVFEKLLYEPHSTALFIYPMKALSYDQLKEMLHMEKETGTDLKTAVYDGDTPKSARKAIRDKSRIILSNPHALHWYLAWHRLWSRFFRNLQYIIVDEAHWYRGIFGTNVAFLLRRLRRILEYYGSDPQFIISSATMADPQEHAKSLTGKEFDLVNKDGSSRGRKTYLFWDTSVNPKRSQHLQTADLTAACVQYGLQTLCFSVSRKIAELIASWANTLTDGAEIVPYRSGYLPEERRKLEKKFKEREIAGISSTNALELGVNIGGLDAVVIGGYPGTISSFHQRAGRAGRSTRESIVIQALYDNPLDTYLLANPHYLFKEPSEQAVISLGNEQIMTNHVLCASEELPLSKEDQKWFGPEYEKVVSRLIGERFIKPHPGSTSSQLSSPPSESTKHYSYNGKGSCFHVSLSDIDGDTFRLVSQGQVLEELSRQQAFSEAYPGAVFLHRAEPFKVVSFDEDSKTIELNPYNNKEMYTTPLKETEIRIEEVFESRKEKNHQLYFGTVNVSEQVYGYILRSFSKTVAKNILEKPLTLQYRTESVWVSFNKLQRGGMDGGFHAVEHLLISVAPLLAMCDRWDLGGVYSSSSKELFLYDGFPGGIGISRRLFQHYKALAEKALEVVSRCSCETGCPKCVMSPKCGSNNEPLSKSSAETILKILI